MTPPRVVARGWVLAGGFRGVGDAAPYGLPGSGRRREVPPHPALRGHLPPRGKAGVVGEGFIPPGVSAAAQAPAGRRGRRALRVAREREVAGGRGGVGAPRPTDGGMETLWGLRGQPFPGRRAVGAGHARPGGLRGRGGVGRSVGRGLDPSAEVGGGGRFPGRRGRRPLRIARGWAMTQGPANPSGHRCAWPPPLMGRLPSRAPPAQKAPHQGSWPSLRGLRGSRQFVPPRPPYPGSWSSVRSWRVRL